MDSDVQEPQDRFKDIVAILIAVIALLAALAAWRASTAARIAGFEDYYALTATLKDGETRTVNTAKAYENYTGFTSYTINNTLLGLLEEDYASQPASTRAIMDYDIWQSEQLAGTNRNFFMSRFVKKSGDYDLTRELDEQYAEAERRFDMNTDVHLDRSNKQDNKTFGFVQVGIVLGVGLLFFTFASVLHAERKGLRWASAIGGIACLVISIVLMLQTEML